MQVSQCSRELEVRSSVTALSSSSSEPGAGEAVVLRDQPWLLVIVAPPPHLSSPHQMFPLIPIYQHLHSRVISRAQGFPG